jgi:hypothetical protein
LAEHFQVVEEKACPQRRIDGISLRTQLRGGARGRRTERGAVAVQEDVDFLAFALGLGRPESQAVEEALGCDLGPAAKEG